MEPNAKGSNFFLDCCNGAIFQEDCCNTKRNRDNHPHLKPNSTSPGSSLRNQMSGVGIVWRVAHSKGIPNDILVVDAFDPQSSAAEADLRPGDILFQVDGEEVIGMPVTSIAEKLFGPVGTQVMITILRGGLNGEVVLVQLERRSSANAA
ncbi:hypothetical protein GUITHDRAFT_149883 [Guillardia theta CCMP2712]|uniref:PDZ domain-containing protein n=1 Tax=Guillardia theta (strain CCMP2712) TaxID=905079 RepID=L1K2N9_GUITC|nr:hypothetical protein GUITHDRAFT_149883 [Guillardia theta CCMP2712]EKX54859.1 hypothetical protein GUITHDRAFT_149883 [Guillardia theta CCMP2712]|mmetsp:Transcript_37445/g.118076  ORF Transcript_37445/g.118076 Transcript_37445/m.118076 type:complete len:150 (-) Transcript_37445:50-499(-)|eukprot:XP_005841839.1 hypothetical protein GUITHDRAFT_149883 [Guillardia theta CCMP2712]